MGLKKRIAAMSSAVRHFALAILSRGAEKSSRLCVVKWRKLLEIWNVQALRCASCPAQRRCLQANLLYATAASYTTRCDLLDNYLP